MRQLFKILTSTAWMLFAVILAAQSANAQKRYPAIEDKWDGTDYRAVLQRVENDGLELPTLSNAATKPVFERMVAMDNIPLHMGLNKELSITVRFQRLDSALDPVHKLVVMYSNEAQKGKPYAAELARLMIYESKISAAMLDVIDPLAETIDRDKRYKARIAELDKLKADARQRYSDLVQRMGETSLYSKPDILNLANSALTDLRSYLPVLTPQDRQDLVQKLAKQISTTTDKDLKTTLTELRDAIEHGRVRT